ncbi:cytochrome P450 4V2 [Ixodes scapularis]|uniref:cytochrome P450 4V2 n=1 Tax=Ixodes scapularis TaxID=6945 RepID=UPI001A9E59E7|nr:cytochrome P450 4V2 [Ixodes scapularis]
MYRFYVGPLPNVMIFKAELVEAVLTSQSTMSKSFDYSLLHSWLGEGLLTSSGAKWKQRRRLLTPSFHFRILDEYVAPMNEHARHMVQEIGRHAETEEISLIPLSTSCTLGILLETIMGVEADKQDVSTRSYVGALKILSDQITLRSQTPWLLVDPIYYRTEYGKLYRRNVEVVHDFTRKVITERRKQLMSEKSPSIPTKIENNEFQKKKLLTFIDILIQQSMNSDAHLTDDDIREEVDTFMFEGHDTTQMAISWCLYLLGLYPKVQAKVHEELEEVLQGDLEKDVTMDDLKQLKYLDCVVKECQRLYPSVPFIGRTVTKDITLGGNVIPEGTNVGMIIFALHRDPDVFPKPEEFDPDRFLPENSGSRNPFAFIPFSAGSRNCIGQRFALMEVKIVLAHILRSFSLRSLHQRDELMIFIDLVLSPAGGLKAFFSKRGLSRTV